MAPIELYPIPPITDPALETRVFTHKSVPGRPTGLVHVDKPGDDNESLAFLGDTVIALVVTVVLGKALPLSRPGDLAPKRGLLVNQDRLASWADAYDLPARLRVHQSAALVLRQNTSARAKVFQAYVGAIFLQHDCDYCKVQAWFGRLVKQGLDEIQSLEQAPEGLTEKLQTLKLKEPVDDHPSVPTPSSPSASNSSDSLFSVSSGTPSSVSSVSSGPSLPSSFGSPLPNSSGSLSRNASPMMQLGTLALFNQFCAQKGISPQWECTNMGTPHRPTHRAIVRFPSSGEPLGSGAAERKNDAKTKAALDAMAKLGWNKAE